MSIAIQGSVDRGGRQCAVLLKTLVGAATHSVLGQPSSGEPYLPVKLSLLRSLDASLP